MAEAPTQRSIVATTIGSSLPSLLSYYTADSSTTSDSSSAATTDSSASTLAQILSELSTPAAQASTNVTLSDDAKAYLASLAQSVSSAQAPAQTLAANARAWF